MPNPFRPASSSVRRSLAAIAFVALALPGCVLAIGGHDCDDANCSHFGHHSSTSDKAHCPVTGESVSKKTAPSATVDGDTYYFHCNTCKQRFLAEPSAYLHGDAKSGSAHDDDDNER